MIMIQADFRCEISSSVIKKTVWTEASWNLKPGMVVSFDGDEKKWTVDKVYEVKIPVEHLRKKWGLDLPKSQRTER